MNITTRQIVIGIIIIISLFYLSNNSGCYYYINGESVSEEVYQNQKGSAMSSNCKATFGVCNC